MKVTAFNGSPRKKWNTATLLEKTLEGAASQGAETNLIHLYDLNYQGCTSCFDCKTKGGESYGRCSINDDLKPLLDKIEENDAIILGSPIYFGCVSGEMRSFMERLLFPYLSYGQRPRSLFPKKIKTGFIMTMNATEEVMEKYGFSQHPHLNRGTLQMIFGASELLLSLDTYQFEDYSKVAAESFDPEKKAKRRKEVFPQDCEKAYEMGVRFTKEVNR
jgi:multimeric flavodoxin WrbA